jgi:hypothetical protein
MNRRTDGTAGAPGVPGPRGGVTGDIGGTPAASLSSSLHRPVKDARNRAGASPAAPSNRGDSLSAAGVVPASTLVDPWTERDAAGGRAEGAPLDLHEGIRDPRDPEGCKRWPEHLRLANLSTGELVLGRCRATNLCTYCARLFAIETSEMLMLDAMEDAPVLYVVLTSRDFLTRSACVDHLRQLRKACRLRWPSVRWAVLVEFQSAGRLHLNLLVKGVPVGEQAALHGVVSDVWCARVDALPRLQWVGAVNDGAGLVRYVSQHFMKPTQAPPIGWRGHRYSATRDYLVRPASLMREEARRSLRIKRKLWAGESLEVAMHAVEAEALIPWKLVGSAGGVDPERQRAAPARRPFTSLRGAAP